MPRINAKKLVERALKREVGKKQVDVAQAMELFGAICFELEEWVWNNPDGNAAIIDLLSSRHGVISRLARAHAKRRKIKVEW